MNNVVGQYQRELKKVETTGPAFPNRNLDIGTLTRAGDYKLADETYSRLVRRLAHNHFRLTTPALRTNILEYFASGPVKQNLKSRDWKATNKALAELKAVSGHPAPVLQH